MTKPGAVYLTPHGLGYDCEFSFVHIQQAAARLGLITIEEYEIVVSSLHHLHVYRVFRLKRAMDDHPPEPGMPRPVKEALADLKALEEMLSELKVPRLAPEKMRERIEALEASHAM
jgi:hypothetical protein